MKLRYLITLAALLSCAALSAQVRTENDIDKGNFVLGADGCVICDRSGAALKFSTKGFVFEARGNGGKVDVKDLQTGKIMTVYDNGLSVSPKGTLPAIGGGLISLAYHDFTGDSNPELIVAVRADNGMAVYVLEFASSTWNSVGELSAASSGVSECRIFRQVLTMRDTAADVLHSWTWRDGAFDYRSSK